MMGKALGIMATDLKNFETVFFRMTDYKNSSSFYTQNNATAIELSSLEGSKALAQRFSFIALFGLSMLY